MSVTSILKPTGNSGAALALVRIVVGVVFAAHGAQKLFTYGLEGVTGSFTQMGVPLPMIVAPLVSILEFAGGLALIAGLFSRPVGALLAANMIGATLIVHLPNGFFLPGGYEFTMTLAAASLGIAIGGPGALALDSRLFAGKGAEQGAGKVVAELSGRKAA